jgi:hypothetical protein
MRGIRKTSVVTGWLSRLVQVLWRQVGHYLRIPVIILQKRLFYKI